MALQNHQEGCGTGSAHRAESWVLVLDGQAYTEGHCPMEVHLGTTNTGRALAQGSALLPAGNYVQSTSTNPGPHFLTCPVLALPCPQVVECPDLPLAFPARWPLVVLEGRCPLVPSL
jgi:hypothetical protein